MVDILVNEKDVEVFLSKQRDKCKIGDLVEIVILERVLEELPHIASKYGFSIIDGENLEGEMIKIKLEFRHQLFS